MKDKTISPPLIVLRRWNPIQLCENEIPCGCCLLNDALPGADKKCTPSVYFILCVDIFERRVVVCCLLWVIVSVAVSREAVAVGCVCLRWGLVVCVLRPVAGCAWLVMAGWWSSWPGWVATTILAEMAACWQAQHTPVPKLDCWREGIHSPLCQNTPLTLTLSSSSPPPPSSRSSSAARWDRHSWLRGESGGRVLIEVWRR